MLLGLFMNGIILKQKTFHFFREDCFFTDDTVMTCAVAEAIMNVGTRCSTCNPWICSQ